ncbi:MAG: primosomal protein N' [Chloroflexi bacterium]|nr:primosomal protein N' [Chloroflexota bacterium]
MRHAEVALDLGRSRSGGSFTYQVPDHLPVRPGDLVLVPLSKRVLPGVVVSVAGSTPDFPTRLVEERLADDPFLGPLQLTLARWISAHYRAPLFDCLALFLPPGLAARLARAARAGAWKAPASLAPAEASRGADASSGDTRAQTSDSVLTLPQQVAAGRIIAALDARQHVAFLLHGVTGSGKTHVYLDAVERTLALNRQAIVLISEIALTPETLGRFERRFPGRTALIHSRLSAAEHRRSWERIRRGDAGVVVGSRSALFAPVRRPGLIILDEEHEWTYKQEMSPRYHAREVALWWGQLAKAPVVLGSATPDVDSFYRAERNRYVLLRLPSRYPRREVDPSASPDPRGDGAVSPPHRSAPGEALPGARPLPAVTVVDMRRELRAGNAGIFSRELADALAEVLDRGEQALLFLNRRGSATCVSCRDCGHVMACRRCDIPLVFHRTDDSLVCHRCNRRQPSPERCPSCGGPRIRYLGLGTQRVEQELQATFPKARIGRWDHDVTSRRGAHEQLWRALGTGEVDVMVGTQMIAKALDFPRVTLVGVVLADVGLFLPDFRAGERAFQLLTQMAGRTGRGPRGGRAIVQTYAPDHYAIRAAARHDYEGFYRREIAFRRAHGYPPIGRLARLVYSGSGEARCVRETARVRGLLEAELGRRGIGDIDLLGPAPCFYRRVRNRERWQIVLRGDRFARVLDHVELPPGWTIDVDPMSLL